MAQVDLRIVIVGTTGSGKTTLARQLSAFLGISNVELDDLYWGPGWQSVGKDMFRARVQAAVSTSTWIVDGNYHLTRDLVWSRATNLIWLDYSLPVILNRLVTRTTKRIIKREELQYGNRETIKDTLFSKDSIILFALRTYRRRRREFSALLSSPEYSHLQVTRLQNPHETTAWLESLKTSPIAMLGSKATAIPI